MNFFDWVIIVDVIATVTIAALILALSISRAGQARSELVEIVRRIVIRTPPSKSGRISTPSAKHAVRAPSVKHAVRVPSVKHAVRAPSVKHARAPGVKHVARAPGAKHVAHTPSAKLSIRSRLLNLRRSSHLVRSPITSDHSDS